MKIRKICECAILIALEVVLNSFVSFKVLGIEFGVSFVPMALAGMLFGPWWAALCYALGDFIGAMLFPTGPFFPGFTLTCALLGACYGLFLHKKETVRLFPEAVCVTAVNTMLLGLLLNSLWMSVIVTSRSFAGWVLYRLPQEIGLAVLHLLLLPLLGRLAAALRRVRS